MACLTLVRIPVFPTASSPSATAAMASPSASSRAKLFAICYWNGAIQTQKYSHLIAERLEPLFAAKGADAYTGNLRTDWSVLAMKPLSRLLAMLLLPLRALTLCACARQADARKPPPHPAVPVIL